MLEEIKEMDERREIICTKLYSKDCKPAMVLSQVSSKLVSSSWTASSPLNAGILIDFKESEFPLVPDAFSTPFGMS